MVVISITSFSRFSLVRVPHSETQPPRQIHPPAPACSYQYHRPVSACSAGLQFLFFLSRVSRKGLGRLTKFSFHNFPESSAHSPGEDSGRKKGKYYSISFPINGLIDSAILLEIVSLTIPLITISESFPVRS